MSRNAKIGLGVAGGVILLCLCGCVLSVVFFQMAGRFFEQALVMDPAEAAEIGGSIADYDLPPGYSEQFGMDFFGFSLVAIMSGQQPEDGIIMMMQFPQFANMDQAEMERQMQDAVQQQMDTRDMQLEPVDQVTKVIRDQEVTLTISEGTDSEGNDIRQLTGVFQGKGGPTVLMILGSIQTWDQAAIDSFIDSIR